MVVNGRGFRKAWLLAFFRFFHVSTQINLRSSFPMKDKTMVFLATSWKCRCQNKHLIARPRVCRTCQSQKWRKIAQGRRRGRSGNLLAAKPWWGQRRRGLNGIFWEVMSREEAVLKPHITILAKTRGQAGMEKEGSQGVPYYFHG